ncbi:MAG TPA: UDP-N-acetylmuramate--L-alanine ligase [bacterium]|nr:UDP-N-acetylmuramate--L-alanine ligase [bacterium]
MNIDPTQVRHIHLIGICGTAMGSLAGMLKSRGYRVTGSDVNVYPPMSDQLAALGIEIRQGYLPEHLDPAPDLVVIGNVVSRGNPEGDAVLARGLPYQSMVETLRTFFFADKTLIAMCGTHGKTTSTAMLAQVLNAAEVDPTYLIGGVLENTQASYRVGNGAWALVEGDEYDVAWFDKAPKFLRYRPDVAAVGNIEFDHADIYPDLDSIVRVFGELIETLPREGLLIAGVDCPRVRSLLPRASCPVVTYGLDHPADLSARLVAGPAMHTTFDLLEHGSPTARFTMNQFGRYNLLNALGVIAAARRVGLRDEQIAAGLQSFAGAKRRQQVLGEAGGVLVIDDFAHHPTAVRVTLEALREARPERRLVAVFEPRTNTSRRRIFQEEYARAFGAAAAVIICEVFAKHGRLPADKLDVAALVGQIGRNGTTAIYAENYDDVSAALAAMVQQGDQLVFLSNGGFGNLPRKTLAGLQRKADQT